jgi:hypothetical protein
MNPGTQSTARQDFRQMNDPELVAERAAVRERLEHQPAAAGRADLAALARVLDAEITVRRSVLVIDGRLAPAGWR